MRILNFGSLNIDYVYGVDHFAAKGQTITSHALDVFPGGKGLNQSIALARAGADVHHAGQVGRDGMFLRDLLESCAVGVTSVVVRDDVRSGNAIIQNDASGDNCIVLYPGANRAIDRDFVDQVLDGYGKGDWLLLQNEISELPYIVSRAKARGMFIVLNPSPADSQDVHAAQGNIEMRLSFRRNRSHKTTVVFARLMFMLQDKPASFILRYSADGRRRI